MIYINPIEILGLQNVGFSSIDFNLIKKAKRKLLADIYLSDNERINYHNHTLTASECKRAIEELSDTNKLLFYYYLGANTTLNQFLASENTNFLYQPKDDSFFKIPGFIEFISPYYSEKLNKTLLNSFQKKDITLFKASLSEDNLITQKDAYKVYKSITNEIQQRIQRTKELSLSIVANKKGDIYTKENIEYVIHIIADYFPLNFLNILPNYFQTQINIIGETINALQVNIWNAFGPTLTSLVLSEHILRLNIESVFKATYKNNLDIFKKEYYKVKEEEKKVLAIKKWERKLEYIDSLSENLEISKITPDIAYKKLTELFTPIELNNLPQFANEIRINFANSLKNLALTCYNSQSNIENSISIINYALQINIDLDTEVKLKIELDILYKEKEKEKEKEMKKEKSINKEKGKENKKDKIIITKKEDNDTKSNKSPKKTKHKYMRL